MDTASQAKRQRPRGLWKRRQSYTPHANPWASLASRRPSPRRRSALNADDDDDDDEGNDSGRSSSSSGSNRRKLPGGGGGPEVVGYKLTGQRQHVHVCSASSRFWATTPFDRSRSSRSTLPASPAESMFLDRKRKRADRKPNKELMRSTIARTHDSLVGRGVAEQQVNACEIEDWDDLRDLFAQATEKHESDDPTEALPLLRGVIHECHRILLSHPDPSVIYCGPLPRSGSNSPDAVTSPSDDWVLRGSSLRSRLETQPGSSVQSCECTERPTAFHTLLGTTLFLFGNLIVQDPSLALEDEPSAAMPYWLAAIDVFETGENLPGRVSPRCELGEDWRMAIMWGRTLVCVADEMVSYSREKRDAVSVSVSEGEGGSGEPNEKLYGQLFSEPRWSARSPFATIVAGRPPVTRRMTLASSTPHELLLLAMDQFSRGIFHMSHPVSLPLAPSVPSSSASASSSVAAEMEDAPAPAPIPYFSRARELYTIATDVLNVAERMPIADERQHWASWADSVFNQMTIEADNAQRRPPFPASGSSVLASGGEEQEEDYESWRGTIAASRGRCLLIVGSAKAETIEDALERGDMSVLGTEDAEEVRDVLGEAVGFLQAALALASAGAGMRAVGGEGMRAKELRSLLTEALVTLGNVTADERAREELYARAEMEGGTAIELEDVEMGDVE